MGYAPNHRTGKDRGRFHLESKDGMGGDMGICFSWGRRMGKVTQGSSGKRGSPSLGFFLETWRMRHHPSGVGEVKLAFRRLQRARDHTTPNPPPSAPSSQVPPLAGSPCLPTLTCPEALLTPSQIPLASSATLPVLLFSSE